MKTWEFISLCVCLCIHSVHAVNGNIAGQGTPDDPYQIADAADMQKFADETYGNTYWTAGVYTRLVADIDLDGLSIAPIGHPPINYAGHFDGNGHVISNAHIQLLSWNTVGLFMNVLSNATVRNLGVENVSIQGQKTYAGGLVGYNVGSISGCHVNGSVEGSYQVGGLVGWNDKNGRIINCSSAANVEGYSTDNDRTAGGLVGMNDGSIVTCRATGNVHVVSELKSSGAGIAGSLVGDNDGSIENCYATGNAFAQSTGSVCHAGGLVGYNGGLVADCYSTGAALSEGARNNFAGGLCGNHIATLRNSFCLIDPPCGRVAWPGFVQNVSCVNSVQMQAKSLFTDVGWDFVDDDGGQDNWRMCVDGISPPRLWWEFPLSDVACPDGIAVDDIRALAAHWLTEDSDPAYYDNADLNADGNINLLDFSVLAHHWMKQ